MWRVTNYDDMSVTAEGVDGAAGGVTDPTGAGDAGQDLTHVWAALCERTDRQQWHGLRQGEDRLLKDPAYMAYGVVYLQAIQLFMKQKLWQD